MKCQGTTSVVPQEQQENAGFSPWWNVFMMTRIVRGFPGSTDSFGEAL